MESAKSRGFNVFTTTLLSSPTQNQGLLRRTLKHLESELSIEVYYFEVSKNEYESKVRELKNRNIYVQNYCGCYGSLCEREFDKYGLLWR
jgi:predicted adenine nucleotide alpha hydrolase (AANH) superfamily ATPase